jgi:hypothetical protein
MEILAQRVGGSGHAARNLHVDFEDRHIPNRINSHVLRRATLNLVLQAGYVFRTPASARDAKQYVSRNGETYYLQGVQLSVIDPCSRQARNVVPGLIHRNRPHPREFDNVIEVIAPDLSDYLQPGLKEWFAIEGPFEEVRPSSAI